MKVKCMILAIVMSLGICGCSGDNNGAVFSTEGAVKVPVAQAYDGYEELQGKDFEILVMPEKIEKPNYEKLYRFYDDRSDKETDKAENEKIIRHFVGDAYDEKKLSEPSMWNAYIYNTPELNLFVQRGHLTGLDRTQNSVTEYPFETLGFYDASERDKKVRFDNEECTVGELFDSMQECIGRDVLPFIGDLEFIPKSVDIKKGSINEKCWAYVGYYAAYKGIKLEDESYGSVEQQGPGYSIMTCYSTNSFDLIATGKDKLVSYTPNMAVLDPIAEEVSEIISLKGAVELLKENLAPYLRQKIDLVELRYCCKMTGPVFTADDAENSRILADYGEMPTYWHEPTWCFYYCNNKNDPNTREAFKVNAITGEITVDRNGGLI